MANRYWVGGTGNWDTTNTTNWDSVSGGSGGLSVPNNTDDVFFDGGSGTGTCTITAVSTAKSLTCTGYNGTIAGTSGLTVSGNVTLNNTGMTWSYTGTLSINATATLTSAGKTFANITKLTGATTLTLADNLTMTGTLGLTAGTLDMNDKTLSTNIFQSINSNNRTLAFGTSGILNLTANANSTIFSTSTGGNLFVTSGSKTVNVTSTANNTVTLTITTGAILAANALDFNFQAGSYNTIFGGTNRNVNFTGYSGSLNNQTRDWVGNVIFSTTMSLGFGTNTNNFSSLGTQTITTNGKTLDFPINYNGTLGTLRLLDTLTQGSTRAFTHTNGTLDLNGQTLIVGTYATAAGTKNITFNGGILRVVGSGTTAFNNANNTLFSTTAGTGSGEIQMTNSGTKTFFGNNAIYYCTLAHNNTGALTVNGNNTFISISSTTGPRTFNFTAGTTQTVENFTATGTSGNVVTLQSTTAGTQWFITKSTSGTVSVDYMSIQDSNASPSSLTWYAGANSTNVSNNNGWIFTAPPAPGGTNSNFLFLWAP